MEKIFFDHPWIIILILLWTLPWKAAALWRAARRGHLGWFLALIILNTFAIFDILYIFFFSGPSTVEKKPNQDDEVRQARMQRYREKQMREQEKQKQLEQQQDTESRQASIATASKRRPTVL